MRILAVTNLYPNPLQPHRGTFNREQLRALSLRHQVRVVAPIAWTDEWALGGKGAAAMPAGRVVSCDGIEVRHPRYVFPPRVLRSRYGHFFRRSIRRAFDGAAAALRPDVVLAAWAYPDGWAAVELARAAGIPVVVKVHGSDLLTLPSVPGRGARTAEALCRADAVIAVSRDLAEKAVAMGAERERVSVVYDGIDPSKFCPGPRDGARKRIGIADKPTVLFVGNLVPVKGVDVLVQACAAMRRRGVEFQCLVVGQGPLSARLREQAGQSGIGDAVRFVGPIPHADLPDWFRAADVFVLPSHSEGVPCVLLEAAACQTPYVASRVGGIPEIAHLNEGEMVAPGDATALAVAMETRLAARDAVKARAPYRRSHADAAADIEAVLAAVVAGKRAGAVTAGAT